MIYELQVENIKCGGCTNSIVNKLKKIDGVLSVDVDIENQLSFLGITYYF